jgi:hypothetical protein
MNWGTTILVTVQISGVLDTIIGIYERITNTANLNVKIRQIKEMFILRRPMFIKKLWLRVCPLPIWIIIKPALAIV